MAQLIFEHINVPQLIVSNNLSTTQYNNQQLRSTCCVTTYKVSASNFILFDSKPSKAKRMNLKNKDKLTAPKTDDITVSIIDIKDETSDTNNPFLYMKFPNIPEKKSYAKHTSTIPVLISTSSVNTSEPISKTISFDDLKQSIGSLKTKLSLRHFKNFLMARLLSHKLIRTYH